MAAHSPRPRYIFVPVLIQSAASKHPKVHDSCCVMRSISLEACVTYLRATGQVKAVKVNGRSFDCLFVCLFVRLFVVSTGERSQTFVNA